MKINNYKFLVIIFNFFCIISCKNNQTDEKNFAISDSSIVSKIIMTDKSGNSVVLKNDNNNWKVNNKFDAWNDQVDYTLKVMEDIRIKSSVAEEKIDYVIKNIAKITLLFTIEKYLYYTFLLDNMRITINRQMILIKLILKEYMIFLYTY